MMNVSQWRGFGDPEESCVDIDMCIRGCVDTAIGVEDESWECMPATTREETADRQS